MTETYRPGVFCWRILAAPISLWIAAAFSYSGSSRSKSIALSAYLLTTCWYAAAVEAGSPQVWPSLVPPYPPAETVTSPPFARMPSITDLACVSEETGCVPSQVGLHPPPFGARMKASWNDFCPVALMTGPRSGGLLSNGMTYGAAPYQLPLSAAGASGSLADVAVTVGVVPNASAAAPAAAAPAGTVTGSPRRR